MRANRPEGFTAHGGVTNWQFPYGMSLDAILRAGSAPNQEEKTPKRNIQRNRQPVRALAVQGKTRTSYKKPEGKTYLKTGELEDDFDDNFDVAERPPCRQNPNLFDLEDSFHPMNGFIKDSGRGIRADIRPPSRHKTPPKALGLELPPKQSLGEGVPIEHMFLQDSASSSVSNENESLSNTMPINLNETDKIRKKFNKLLQPEQPESKIRLKPRSAKMKSTEKVSIRMWSAGKAKQKKPEVPVILNKREKGNHSFSNSRKEKSKFEEERKEMNEEKRINAYKKVQEKRAFSSQNKAKIVLLPFQTNLEPEFLNLFAKPEDLNF